MRVGTKRLTRLPMLHPAFRSKVICTLSCTALLMLPGAVFAQNVPLKQPSGAVVQPLPQKSAGMRLNDALGRLARNPKDVPALIEAGTASLELGDAQASIGFYQRALQDQPGNAGIKASLAGAYVMAEDPFTAIELFDEAEKAGAIAPDRLSDRGLAFDLVGDPQTAQFYYRQSLAGALSDETLRRLALSQAISRDRKGMDQTLAPLLQRQDKAAWRTRAFGLAIMGQTDEAEAIARQTMPPEMAGAITAYLRYMPQLTAAQQAAAGNMGRFPRAAEIGHDDPRLAYYSRSRVQVAAPPPVALASASVNDKGKRRDAKRRDSGKDSRGRKAVSAAPVPAAVPPPEPNVGREVSEAPVKLAVAQAPPKPVPLPALAPKPVPAPAAPPPPVAVKVTAPKPAPTGPGFNTVGGPDGQSASGFDLGKSPSAAPPPAPTPPPAPKPVQAAPPPPRKPASIDEAFADFTPPSREVEVQAGAVDVRRIRPGAAPGKLQPGKGKEPVKDAKPAVPSHPSRIWVQVATGRDKSALGFDWRKLAKDNLATFKGQKPNVTAWGQSNRLLAGPFATTKEANAFLAALKKAGVGGAFVWTSPAGQLVDTLGGGK